MNSYIKTSLTRQAANAYANKQYSEALRLYRELSKAIGETLYSVNIARCIKKMSAPIHGKDYTKISLKQLRVACIMDNFTFQCYEPECELLQLHPQGWKQQLEEFKPDFLFLESAWFGLDSLWKTKLSNASAEILALVEYCKLLEIPTLFWNKEDPVHFNTFIMLARQVDYVFTTDIDCIADYKQHLGHNRVYLLPFAAQPALHNPIERFERKDAFNFAGSYYMRYPERQRDFAALIKTVTEFGKVDIYDRQYDNPHPHYTFPEQYRSLIIGKLPFNEIDRAYKGYRYGINMNSIKQSQTMFARRVYELLASNTLVISNFSRGVRQMFGDLVISSDDSYQLRNSLSRVCTDDLYYKKLRLLGLRNVMSQHTYAHRLAHICSVLSARTFQFSTPILVYLLAVVTSAKEMELVVAHFTRQIYSKKKLIILQKGSVEFSSLLHPDITLYQDATSCLNFLMQLSPNALFGVMDPNSYYGPCYLTDLQLACAYSNAEAFGKVGHYFRVGAGISLRNPNCSYRPALQPLPARASLAHVYALSQVWLAECLENTNCAVLELPNMLAIDEFNYIESGAELLPDVIAQIDDLPLLNKGNDVVSLNAITEILSAEKSSTVHNSNMVELTGSTLYSLMHNKISSKNIKLAMREGHLHISSMLKSNEHEYLYANKIFTREELNLILNTDFLLLCRGNLKMRTVFEFRDEKGKIAHAMNNIGNNWLAIPEECTHLRFGLRFEGAGQTTVERLVMGKRLGAMTMQVVPRAPYLIIANQYPSYDDLYRYGFLHSRVRAYIQHGLSVEVFRVRRYDFNFKEFENVDITTGSLELLDNSLAIGHVQRVLVHLLDEDMWSVLVKHIDRVPVIVWVHGVEIQSWKRRQFNFSNGNSRIMSHQIRMSEQRKEFWLSILKNPHPNLHLVFVSNIFYKEVLEDLEIHSLPSQLYSIIHNFVDSNIFTCYEKKPEHRLRILSIRSFANQKYANDITVKTILELSTFPFFKDLSFRIVGDGKLFEETVAPLRCLKNVHITQGFLSQPEIAELQKEYGIFLCPTRWDSQGVSRDEAMASGLVPVTNDVGAVSEFVDDSCGCLAPPEDHIELARAIKYLYENPDKFLKLSKAASLRVRKQSNFKQTISREIDLITDELE